jgi:hypothetical protein
VDAAVLIERREFQCAANQPDSIMRYRMNAYRIAALALASLTGMHAAHALENPRVAKIVLACPDRSPRMADVELAMSTAHISTTAGERRRMLEHARSLCAENFTVVSLIPPASQVEDQVALLTPAAR